MLHFATYFSCLGVPTVINITIDSTIPLMPVLECSVVSSPNTTIIWLDTSGQRIISDPQGTYTISTTGPDANFMFVSQLQFNVNATLSDQGIYTCNATNTIGSDQRTTNLTITCKRGFIMIYSSLFCIPCGMYSILTLYFK